MTEQGFEERFLQIVAQNRDDKTRYLAREFYYSLHSGRFYWIGLGEVQDQLNMHHLTVYLAEISDLHRQQDITDPTIKLSLNLHPDTFLNLFFIPPGSNRSFAELIIEDMTERFRSTNYQPNPRLLFEETIIPPVFFQNL